MPLNSAPRRSYINFQKLLEMPCDLPQRQHSHAVAFVRPFQFRSVFPFVLSVREYFADICPTSCSVIAVFFFCNRPLVGLFRSSVAARVRRKFQTRLILTHLSHVYNKYAFYWSWPTFLFSVSIFNHQIGGRYVAASGQRDTVCIFIYIWLLCYVLILIRISMCHSYTWAVPTVVV